MSLLNDLSVRSVEVRKNSQTGEEFPVAIVNGTQYHITSGGNRTFVNREVSIPLQGFSLEQAKQKFWPGRELPEFCIVKREVKPYQWTVPARVDSEGNEIEPAQVRTFNHTYDIELVANVTGGGAQSQPMQQQQPAQRQSTRMPVDEVGTEQQQAQPAQPAQQAPQQQVPQPQPQQGAQPQPQAPQPQAQPQQPQQQAAPQQQQPPAQQPPAQPPQGQQQ